MPRTLLMIDELEEFFTEEDRVAQGAAVWTTSSGRAARWYPRSRLADARRGRYTLARATLGQMVIRIALQCNEADAYLMMDQDNPAPRLLSRPSEGIYNDSAGSSKATERFKPCGSRIKCGKVNWRKSAPTPTTSNIPGAVRFRKATRHGEHHENSVLGELSEQFRTKRGGRASGWARPSKAQTEQFCQRQSGGDCRNRRPERRT